MKPHEETWTANDGAVWCGDAIVGRFDGDLDVRTDRSDLAAQAPAMARLLLELHTEGKLTPRGSRSCPVCESTWRERITGKNYEPSHYDHCELSAVLRAAGVLS